VAGTALRASNLKRLQVRFAPHSYVGLRQLILVAMLTISSGLTGTLASMARIITAAIFQFAGRSTLIQNDRVTGLTAGDVALVDATQPVTYISENRPADGSV
jgi:hypothetical protein